MIVWKCGQSLLTFLYNYLFSPEIVSIYIYISMFMQMSRLTNCLISCLSDTNRRYCKSRWEDPKHISYINIKQHREKYFMMSLYIWHSKKKICILHNNIINGFILKIIIYWIRKRKANDCFLLSHLTILHIIQLDPEPIYTDLIHRIRINLRYLEY